MNSSRNLDMSLSGRSFGDRKVKGGRTMSSKKSIDVRVPESNLQRHEAAVRVLQERNRKKVLRHVLFCWNTAQTLQRFLQV